MLTCFGEARGACGAGKGRIAGILLFSLARRADGVQVDHSFRPPSSHNYPHATCTLPAVTRSCPKYQVRKGAALAGMGQTREAVRAYQEALDIDPIYPGAVSGMEEARKALRRSHANAGSGGSD